jgi:Outer membrane protein beta-barrel domain
MSNLKDTDIDDLFRRASEKYPLRTDSSDWDKMSAALEKDPPPPDDGTDTTDRRRKRRFFWLFFLLPLGVGGLGYYAWHSGVRTQAGTTAKASAATSLSATVNTPSATETPAANPSAASGTSTPTRIAPTTTAGGSTATSKTGATDRVGRSLLAKAGRGTNTDPQPNNNHQGNADRQGNTGHPTNGVHYPETDLAAADINISTGTNTQATGNPFSSSLTQNHQNRQDRLFYDLQREPVDRNYQLKVNVVAPTAKKDSTATKQKTSNKTKASYLYLGLIGAPDLSTVKMQSVKEVGNTFGVLVGYGFSPHWAIETGAYLDRKKYYTEGEYFNTKEVTLPVNATLSNVNGTCYMWEIPLNLRYTFNPEAKTRWFATAGLTTYLMTSEKYTYGYESYGGGTSWPATSKWNIKTPSQYPFSIVSLSAGFEQKLGKIGNLRIEPYLRIPLTGMGAGKLPIMSTGINIGITRQLWKK